MSFTSASDRLALAVIAVLAVVAALAGSAHAAAMLACFACVIVLVALWGTRSRIGTIAHDLSPAIFIPCMFNLVFPVVVACNAPLEDHALARLDVLLFGDLFVHWRSLLGRPTWLIDFASAAYISFYFVPFLLGVSLYMRRRMDLFRSFVLAVQLAFFLPFAGYLLVPALGPRMARDALGGGVISDAVHAFLDVVEVNVLDAFPSAHTSVTLVVLALGWRAFPRVRAPLVFMATSIVFSTVYLSLHYVIDLVGGAIVALVVLFGLARIGRLFGLTPSRALEASSPRTDSPGLPSRASCETAGSSSSSSPNPP